MHAMNIGLRCILVAMSAVIGILVFPPIGFSWLAVVAWIPLLIALGEAKPSHALYLGLLHGAVFFGVTMSWLANVFTGSSYAVVPLVLIMALFTALFARGYAVASVRYRKGWLTAVFAASWWIACEFYRSEIFYLKFPWMTPGVGLGPNWVSPLLGVYGISFLLIFGSALVAQGSVKKKWEPCVGGLLLLVLLFSSLVPRQVSEIDRPVTVLAVQNEVSDIDLYIKLTREGDPQVDLIIWPEYSLPSDVRRSPHQWRQLTGLAEETGAILVVGTQTSRDDGGWHNTALTLTAEGDIGEHYKNHPVHFFDDGVPGTEARAVETSLGKIGTPICFDCDYEDVIRRMVADGAEFLAIPSMDAIHWGEKEHHQHAELFRHRAAENGRWIAVAATSGVTQIIDPYGNRVDAIPIIEEGTLKGKIGRRSGLTVYTRLGWLFPWIVMVIGMIWVLWLFAQNLLEKRKDRDTRIA